MAFLFADMRVGGVARFADQIGSAGQSVSPNVAVLTIAGFAPFVSQAASQSASPGVASLTLTGFAPTIAQSASGSVSPGAATLVVQGYAPTVLQLGAIATVPDARRLVVTTSAFRPVPAPFFDIGLPTLRAGSRLDYEFDWAGEFPGPWLSSGETISSVTLSSFGPVDVSLRGQQGGKVQVWASAHDDASPGMYCAAICSITTSLGRTDSRRFELVTQAK